MRIFLLLVTNIPLFFLNYWMKCFIFITFDYLFLKNVFLFCFEFSFIWFYYPSCSFLFVFADFVLCQKISVLCFLLNWILFVSSIFNMKFYPFYVHCNNWYTLCHLLLFVVDIHGFLRYCFCRLLYGFVLIGLLFFSGLRILVAVYFETAFLIL